MTDIIDGGTYVRATNYTGPGTIDGHCLNAGGVAQMLSGYFTSAGNAVQINTGFKPRLVEAFNETDVLLWRWQHGMAAANSLKFNGTGPAITVDTGTMIAISTDSPVGDAGNHTVTLHATLCGTSKNITFVIRG